MKQTKANAMEIRPLKEVLTEIRETLQHPGVAGVLGFCITVRNQHSTTQLKWGDTRIKIRKTR